MLIAAERKIYGGGNIKKLNRRLWRPYDLMNTNSCLRCILIDCPLPEVIIFELYKVISNCAYLKKFTNNIKVSFQVSRQVILQVCVLPWRSHFSSSCRLHHKTFQANTKKRSWIRKFGMKHPFHKVQKVTTSREVQAAVVQAMKLYGGM